MIHSMRRYGEGIASVIIPAYNAEDFIEEALESVLAQTWRDVEVIVVDDGSTDGTSEIATSFEHVKYIYQSNKGPAAARNVGLSLAKGEYIAFLDADDVWCPEMLTSCLQILENRPDIGAVHTNWQHIDAEGCLTPQVSNWRPLRGSVFEELLVEISFITPAIVWRRKWLDLIGGLDQTPGVNDDWLNWLRMARQGCLFDCIERPLVLCRRHDRSLTRTQGKRVVRWRLRSLDIMCEEFVIAEDLRARAYGNAHWVATVEALRRGDFDEVVSHFRNVVLHCPDLLDEYSTYFALACPDDLQTRRTGSDLKEGRLNLEYILEEVFNSDKLPERILSRKKVFFSMAYLSLARMAYVDERISDLVARALLCQAVRVDPGIFMSIRSFPWLARILIGGRMIRLAKRFVKRVLS